MLVVGGYEILLLNKVRFNKIDGKLKLYFIYLPIAAIRNST